MTNRDEPLDMAALNADDALLDRLARGEVSEPADPTEPTEPAEPADAVTWDGTVKPPAEITDAIIWTDQPVRPPSGTPVKKGRAEADPAAHLLAALRADVSEGLVEATREMCPAPDVEVATARPGSAWAQTARPGSSWARVARRTGTRGAAAAAAVLVSLGGVAAATVAAGPGNPLYGVHKLIAGANPTAEQSYAVQRVVNALGEAQTALDDDQPGRAHGKVTVAEARLKAVTPGTVKDDLVHRHDMLAAAIAVAMRHATSPTTGAGTSGTPGSTTGSTTGGSDGTTSSDVTTSPDGSTATVSPTTTPADTPTTTPTPTLPGKGSTEGNGHGDGDGQGKSDENGKGKGDTTGHGTKGHVTSAPATPSRSPHPTRPTPHPTVARVTPSASATTSAPRPSKSHTEGSGRDATPTAEAVDVQSPEPTDEG